MIDNKSISLDVDVRQVIKKVHEADINVMANYIFGFNKNISSTIRIV